MQSCIRIPLKLFLVLFMVSVLPVEITAARREIPKDTIEVRDSNRPKVLGKVKANVSRMLGIVTILVTYVMSGIYFNGIRPSGAILLAGPLIGALSLLFGFKSLRENRSFLTSGAPVNTGAKARQKKVRKAAIAGLTITFFGIILALISILGNLVLN